MRKAEVPKVVATPMRGGLVRVTCIYCRNEHVHGAPWTFPYSNNVRQSHCSPGGSYRLVPPPALEAKLRKEYERSLLPRKKKVRRRRARAP